MGGGFQRAKGMSVALAIAVAVGAQACAAAVPTTPVMPSGSAAASESTSTAAAPPTPAPTPTPVTTPLPLPTPVAPILGSWDIILNPGEPDVPVALHVIDRAGTMVDVGAAVRPLTVASPEDPHALEIGPGSDERSITVGWTGGVCDERAELQLATSGRTLTLQFPPRAGCDAMGVGFAVELRFAASLEPADFGGRWGNDLITIADLRLLAAVAFADPLHGWVGGRTVTGDAVILETADGGATWRIGGLAMGELTDIAVTGDGGGLAGLACLEDVDDCRSGRYRYEGDGLWGRASLEVPLRLAFAGDAGAGVFAAATPGLRLSDDGGESWTSAGSPCPAPLHLGDAARVDAATVVAVCESQGAGGGSTKVVFWSKDGGGTWAKLADGPYSGTGMGIDMLPDGTGWLWGLRSPLLATSDGGMIWSPLDIADGDVRIVSAADAWGSGPGAILVRDPDRRATLLLRTDDGRAWTELFSWPAGAGCCG